MNNECCQNFYFWFFKLNYCLIFLQPNQSDNVVYIFNMAIMFSRDSSVAMINFFMIWLLVIDKKNGKSPIDDFIWIYDIFSAKFSCDSSVAIILNYFKTIAFLCKKSCQLNANSWLVISLWQQCCHQYLFLMFKINCYQKYWNKNTNFHFLISVAFQNFQHQIDKSVES